MCSINIKRVYYLADKQKFSGSKSIKQIVHKRVNMTIKRNNALRKLA